MFNPLLFFGRLHPLLVHLPIGFLTLLAVVELASRIHRFKHVGQARGTILLLTVAASIVTVLCGLMLASGGGYDSGLLFWHKWMGITLAILVIATAIAFWRRRYRIYTGLLIATLVVMAPSSHFGGSMTHGKEYLTEYAPSWMRGTPAVKTIAIKQPLNNIAQARLFGDLVQPVLKQNCLACHSADKTSGGLRLDSYQDIKQGGKSGPVFVTGNSDASVLMQRIALPVDDPKHMPPDGKPQLTDDQIAILRWWIDSGAPEHQSIADLDGGPEQTDLVARLLKLPAPVDATSPKSLDEIASRLSELSSQLGVVITPVAVDQPWVSCNAAVVKSFGDTELLKLASIGSNIITLNLAGTKVTDAGLAAVRQMPNLQQLRLERTVVTDAGLKNLSKLRKLDYLNLYGTTVTDAGLQALKGLPSLRHLYLWQTKVTPDAAAKFASDKTDQGKINRIQQQIADLQAQIANQHMEVVGGVSPTTKPAPQKPMDLHR
jgi:uncharacterized membrane protein